MRTPKSSLKSSTCISSVICLSRIPPILSAAIWARELLPSPKSILDFQGSDLPSMLSATMSKTGRVLTPVRVIKSPLLVSSTASMPRNLFKFESAGLPVEALLPNACLALAKANWSFS